MKKDDLIKITVNDVHRLVTFIRWVNDETIEYVLAGNFYMTNYKSVIVINGRPV